MILHSDEAEQAVLGALMLDNSISFEVFGELSAGDFYREGNALIFIAILSLHEQRKPMDFVTVSESLRASSQLEAAGGLAYLGALANDTPSAASALTYARIVREKSRRREIVRLCAEISAAARNCDADELAQKIGSGLSASIKIATGRAKSFPEALSAAEAIIIEASKSANGIVGVPSGLPALDSALSGFRPGRLYGISARPGTGKTALLNQIGVYSASRGRPGLIASLEMGEGELVIRAMAANAGVNVTKLFNGRPDVADRAIEKIAALGDIPLWISADTYSLAGILSQAAYYKHRHGIEWLAVDHIGLVETERFASRNDQIGHITRSLKKAAKQLDIAVIALTQLSRASEKENRKPGLHDLRDSGNIEQDLDAALFLHCKPEDRDKPVRPIEIGALKNRGGRVGWLPAQFEFDGATQTFRELYIH